MWRWANLYHNRKGREKKIAEKRHQRLWALFAFPWRDLTNHLPVGSKRHLQRRLQFVRHEFPGLSGRRPFRHIHLRISLGQKRIQRLLSPQSDAAASSVRTLCLCVSQGLDVLEKQTKENQSQPPYAKLLTPWALSGFHSQDLTNCLTSWLPTPPSRPTSICSPWVPWWAFNYIHLRISLGQRIQRFLSP